MDLGVQNEAEQKLTEVCQENALVIANRVPEELWTEVHDIAQKTGVKTISKRKKN